MYENMTGSTHVLNAQEIAVAAMPEDERVWVPQASDVWFRPLMLNTLQGCQRPLESPQYRARKTPHFAFDDQPLM